MTQWEISFSALLPNQASLFFPLKLISSVHSLVCFPRSFDGFLLLLGLCQETQGMNRWLSGPWQVLEVGLPSILSGMLEVSALGGRGGLLVFVSGSRNSPEAQR